jgi:hypothetical protein
MRNFNVSKFKQFIKDTTTLETSKVNFNSSCRPLVAGLRDAQELALDFEGHTNSATYTSFSLFELSESYSTTCTLDR